MSILWECCEMMQRGITEATLCSRRPKLMILGCISGRLRKILPHWNVAIVWINSHLVHPCLISSSSSSSSYRGCHKPCWSNGQRFQLLLNPLLICFQNKFLFTKFVFLGLFRQINSVTLILTLMQCWRVWTPKVFFFNETKKII